MVSHKVFLFKLFFDEFKDILDSTDKYLAEDYHGIVVFCIVKSLNNLLLIWMGCIRVINLMYRALWYWTYISNTSRSEMHSCAKVLGSQ